jgi:hypothetical protein
MTAVFGTMFGLAAVAGIFALLIQVFPVRPEPAVATPEVSASATATATATAASGRRQRVRVPLPGPWRLSALDQDGSVRIVRGTMDRRSFIVALDEAGVPKAEIYRLLKSMEGVRKFDRCGRRDTFAVAMKRGTNKAVAFEYEVSPTEIYQSREDDSGLLRGERLDMKVRTEEFATSFYVSKDLEKSYRFGGLEKGILAAINKAFHGRTSHEAFEEGGIVKLIAVEQTALGLFARYERVKVVEYRPPDPSQQPVRAYYFEGESFRGYVDGKGRAPSKKGWRTPVPGAPITSPFNPKRMHPILKRVRPHNGTDFGATSGTPVYAAFRGTVQSASYAGGYGNLVIVDHPGGITTYYAHLARFADGLKGGMKVGTRQLVGYVGSTGRSTGPHLHFGAKKNGSWFDPMSLNMDAWRPLPAGDRATFLQTKRQLDGLLEAIPLPEPPPEEPAPEEEPAEDQPADDDAPAEAPADDEDPAEAPADRPRPAPKPERPEEEDGTDLLGEDLSQTPE